MTNHPTGARRGPGRPPTPTEDRHQQISFRLSPEVAEALRGTPKGTRSKLVDDLLRRELLG